MEKLTSEQEKLIESYFHEFRKSVDFQEEMSSRNKRRESVLEILDQNELNNMDEIVFGEFISNLWASRIWGNKDYLVQKIIDDNGIDKIKTQFYDLLYGEGLFNERFDKFIKEIKGLGPSSLTEILCLFNSEKFCIWTDRIRKALSILKFNNLPLKKYYISGEEYENINETLMLITKKLQDLDMSDADLLAVDYFLYEIWYSEKEKKEVKEKAIQESFEFDHNEVRDFVKDIGVQLGFETDVEKSIATGSRADIVWRAKIANLGVVTYVFEVHKRGSIDSLILNLQKALNNPTVQKIIAISNKEQIEKISQEVKSLPENFRKSLTFWEVSDVIKTHEKLSEVMQSINKLELVKSQFEE